MKETFELLSSAWAGIALIGFVLATIFTWVATRNMRKQMNSAYAQTIKTYELNATAKDALAQTLAVSTAKQIELLTTERKESDVRHEKTIDEYRSNLHAVRNDLQTSTVTLGEYKERLADLNARTDFKPVLEFQQTWRRESDAMMQELLATNKALAPILQETAAVLKRFAPPETKP